MKILKSHPTTLKYRWSGSEKMYLDKPVIQSCGKVIIGCYGGNSSVGANKNEDGALVWCKEDGTWTFAVLLDAHSSSQSTDLVLEMIEAAEESIVTKLNLPIEKVFSSLHLLLLDLFNSVDFNDKCNQIRGEAACLICVQKENFLWWLSIGDCLVYLFHPELANLGQYALNQRSFYEWIGQVNTFDLAVPCYASGTRELRQGENQILMITDGILECGSRPFEHPEMLYEHLAKKDAAGRVGIQSNVLQVLKRVDQEKGRDSATLINWSFDNKNTRSAYPSG